MFNEDLRNGDRKSQETKTRGGEQVIQGKRDQDKHELRG